jgi:hypothetical protein
MYLLRKFQLCFAPKKAPPQDEIKISISVGGENIRK